MVCIMTTAVTTAIVVKVTTLEKLKRIMNARHAESLDQTINSLIETSEHVPSGMFGMDRARRMRLSQKEHKEFQRRWKRL